MNKEVQFPLCWKKSPVTIETPPLTMSTYSFQPNLLKSMCQTGSTHTISPQNTGLWHELPKLIPIPLLFAHTNTSCSKSTIWVIRLSSCISQSDSKWVNSFSATRFICMKQHYIHHLRIIKCQFYCLPCPHYITLQEDGKLRK